MWNFVFLVAAGLSALLATSASATLLTVTATNASNTVTFQIDQNPTPGASTTDYFALLNYPANWNGTSAFWSLQFWTNPGSFNGGFTMSGQTLPFLTFTGGPQLFSGPVTSPTLLIGSYSYVGDTRISVAAVQPGVPEPASWAMLIVGFGLVGQARRRQKARVAVTAG